MKTWKQWLLREQSDEEDSHGLTKHPWEKNPRIGWWKDHSHNDDPDHMTMYHGTHVSRLHDIAKNGLKAPEHGPTKGWVSLTHDPHTAHGYASMGGESAFRAAGSKARHVPDHERAVLKLHVPRKWADENMSHHMRGNIPETRDRLLNKSQYDAHKAAGKTDHEYYATTELRFKNHVPPHFISGYMKKKD